MVQAGGYSWPGCKLLRAAAQLQGSTRTCNDHLNGMAQFGCTAVAAGQGRRRHQRMMTAPGIATTDLTVE